MEDMTINALQLLTSYGALGICTLYFMVKDWLLSKRIEESLDKFTLAVNLLINKGGVINE